MSLLKYIKDNSVDKAIQTIPLINKDQANELQDLRIQTVPNAPWLGSCLDAFLINWFCDAFEQ